MQARKIGEGIWWVGAVDWDRRLFDSLIPLPDGTSYNAYFVQGTEKSALIDAVDPAMRRVLFERLQSLNLSAIDYVIANHAEQDHSGCIPDILDAYPMAKVVTSDKGKSLVMDLLAVPEDRILTVKDGEAIELGDKTLQFRYFPWVHWPETMITWLPQQKILFTCDLFGSHLASSELFVSDEAALLQSAKRYYAEIMMPFRTTIEMNLSKVLNLGPQMIAPSHGPIHRRPRLIIDAYRDWVSGPPKNLVVVPYITMHESTRLMVEHFVEACATRGIITEQFDLTEADIGKLAMLLVDAAGVVFGSPMVLAGPHPKVAYAALLANALRPKATFASVLGSFGWGGRLVETLQSLMPALKIDLLPPVLAKGLPRAKDFAAIDALADSVRSRIAQPKEQASAQAEASGKYICPICRYVYDPVKGDPAGGIPPGTPFDKIPENWVCPICRVAKKLFKPI
ncbi:MAG TPA: rubredoxin [Acidobacteriota bacterium]|nr:rubredoxin [Acidobacteriota bacterium]